MASSSPSRSPSPTPPTRRLQTLRLNRSPSSSPPARNHNPNDPDAEDASFSPVLPAHTQNQTQNQDAPLPTEEQRVAALQRELQLLKTMNSTLSNLHHTLSVSKDNLSTLRTTIGSSAVLLDTWTRILSQAEHNSRLIADPGWEGATEDAALTEREEVERKARVEREREERELRERERLVRATTPVEKAVPAGRGLGMGRGRGPTGRRAVSGIGRRGSVRGRGRA